MSKDQLTREGSGGYGSLSSPTDYGSSSQPSYMASGYMNYDEMCEEISKNVYLINTGGNKLEKCTQMIGTDSDSVKIRDRVHDASLTTGQVVSHTMTLLKKAAASRQTEKIKQVQLDRLKTQFQESVQRFTMLQKAAAEKVRLMGAVKERASSGRGFMDDDYGDKQALLAQDERMEHLQDQEQKIDSDVELIREREERIVQLETDILDVNTIFRDLGAMIHEQGTTIDLIESNVDTAYSHVETGTTQLNKASTYQKKARKKLCILLIILLVVAAIIAIIIGTQVK